MKKTAAIIAALMCCVLFMGAAHGSAPVLPTRSFYVNDYADIVNDDRRDSLLSLAREVYDITGAQVVLLTVKNLGGLEAAEYAEAVFAGWHIGGDGQTGALILVAKDDSEAYVYVGQGLSGSLSEKDAERIRDESLADSFSRGEYTEGVSAAFRDVVTLIFAARGEEVSFEEAAASGSGSAMTYAVLVAGIGIITLRGYRIAMRARRRALVKPYVYKRADYKQELIPDEDDYPSGFGGAVHVTVREPENTVPDESGETCGDGERM